MSITSHTRTQFRINFPSEKLQKLKFKRIPFSFNHKTVPIRRSLKNFCDPLCSGHMCCWKNVWWWTSAFKYWSSLFTFSLLLLTGVWLYGPQWHVWSDGLHIYTLQFYRRRVNLFNDAFDYYAFKEIIYIINMYKAYLLIYFSNVKDPWFDMSCFWTILNHSPKFKRVYS